MPTHCRSRRDGRHARQDHAGDGRAVSQVGRQVEAPQCARIRRRLEPCALPVGRTAFATPSKVVFAFHRDSSPSAPRRRFKKMRPRNCPPLALAVGGPHGARLHSWGGGARSSLSSPKKAAAQIVACLVCLCRMIRACHLRSHRNRPGFRGSESDVPHNGTCASALRKVMQDEGWVVAEHELLLRVPCGTR
jgi:hypothetical protein